MDQETKAMQLIVNAGNAKSLAMEAMAAGKKGDFVLAEQKLQQSNAAMTEAHRSQTEILQQSFDEPEMGVTMLMAHAQDHMMSAMTALEFSQEFIHLYQLLRSHQGGPAKTVDTGIIN